MGKPTGFMEYSREVPADRCPLTRINDWEEFRLTLSEQGMIKQAGRCMECGTPFCHTGLMLAGMTSGCPLNNLIPEWNDMIYRGLWKEALNRLLKTNNFPEFTGRVCPAPCEGSCTLGIHEPAVTIKNNELSIVEEGYRQGWIVPFPPKTRTGKRVAVVGSGPAGLACGDQLNKAGHEVTVFERADRIGGLLTYGIPNMKLDKRIVARRVEQMKQSGITFITGVEIGTDLPASQLQQTFDALVVCGGATKPRDLMVEGRHLDGIHWAMDFLEGNTKSILDPNGEKQYISAQGKQVVVIGGGDTGTDCVATSLRQGCSGVVQLEIMPKPPLERESNNPWPQFPKLYKLDYGQEEAKAVFGDDPRQYQVMTERIVGDCNGRVKEIHTILVDWEKDNEGRMIPRKISGTERVYLADLVLIAMGFLGPEDLLLDQLGIIRDKGSNAKTGWEGFVTNVKGVFVAGDMRRGQSLVVWAIAEGRGAAKECDRYLMDLTKLP